MLLFCTLLVVFLIQNVSKYNQFSFYFYILNCFVSKQNFSDQEAEETGHGHKKFTHCPNDISSLLTSQPTTSLNLIHHNYIDRFQNLEEIVNAIDCLSYSDVILNEWRSDLSAELGINLTVRGMMTSNENPVTGRWMPIRGAKNQLKS